MEETWELAAVTTSANLLYDLLKEASAQTPSNVTSLIEAIGSVLGYNNGQDFKAYSFTCDLVSRLDGDLTRALSSEDLNHATGYMSKFRVLYHMPIYVKSLHHLLQANQLLSDSSLRDLLTIGLFLSGKVERFSIEKTPEYESAISDLIESLEQVKLPNELNEAILKRIQQVQMSIDNFHYFGEKSVRESLEKLIGAVELYTPTKIKKGVKGKALFKALTTAVGCVSVIVVGSEKTLGSSIKMIGHYETISGYLEDNTVSETKNTEEE